MYNGMMDPEVIRLAEEHMSRISPNELDKIQQLMSNPEILKLASESLKDMRSEDFKHAAAQLRNARREEMAEISEKMMNATPEEIAAMRARADAHVTYGLTSAERLKKEGNILHNRGKFHEAVQKYLLAKRNLENLPVSKGRAMKLACSLNLMSCYLKTRQYEDCITEGSEVLSYDPKNIKALYRRGQAYRDTGNLKDAVSDLMEAHELSPDDETIANVLRDANERYVEDEQFSRGMVTADRAAAAVVGERVEETQLAKCGDSGSEHQEAGGFSCSNADSESNACIAGDGCSQDADENSGVMRSFQRFDSNTSPTLQAPFSGIAGVSPATIKSASDTISKMSPEELQKMLDMATSANGNCSNGLQPLKPDMMKAASEIINKMSQEEMKKMFEIAASFNGAGPFQTVDSADNIQMLEGTIANHNPSERRFHESLPISGRSSTMISEYPAEGIRDQMKDTSTMEIFSSVIKNMNPEIVAKTCEQFGMKLSPEEAARAQQTMSALSLDDIDRMMRWVDRIRKVADGAKTARNWLFGRHGMFLAICMLVLAVILHRLGYIGG